MKSHRIFLFALALFGGTSAAALPAKKNTPKRYLEQAFALANKWQPDAALVLIRGGANLDRTGQFTCAMTDKVGWYYKFYSPKADRYYYAVACDDEIQGEIADKHDRNISNVRPIPKDFLDTPAVIQSVRKLSQKRGEKRCGAYAAKLLFGQPDDHGAALEKTLIWDVYYQCAGDKDQSKRWILNAHTGKPVN